jgi:hypothetical protein
MSFIYEDPIDLAPASTAKGAATFSAIWSSAREAARFVDNFNASDKAMEEAYDRRIEAVRKATGQELGNPYRQSATLSAFAGSATLRSQIVEANKQDFRKRLGDLQRQYPAMARDIRADVPMIEDAKQIAREASVDFDEAFASRDDFAGKWAAALGGGFAGSLRDPLQVGTLMLGAGPGASKTVAGRILSTAAKEFVINGAIEAAQQPVVQGWRAEAGLPSGFDQGVYNTLVAAGFGGLAGGVFQGGAEALARVFAPVADTLPSPARGALQATEADQALAAARPPDVAQDLHELNAAAAIRAAEDGTRPEIVDVIDVKARAQWNNRPPTIMEFIAGKGGLRDDDGELAARGLNFRNTMTKFGPAYRAKGEDAGAGGGLFGDAPRRTGKGLSPDEMREALVEAGYLDDMANTTPDDMYRLIDRQIAGETVISRADQAWQAEIDAERQARESVDELDGRYEPHEAAFIRDHGYAAFEDLRAAEIDVRTLAPDDLELAKQIQLDEQIDFGDALERAALMSNDRLVREVADEAGLDDIPIFDEVPNARPAGNGRPIPPGGGADQIRKGKGRVRGVRGQVRHADQAAPDPRSQIERDAPGPAEGGLDDVTAPEVATQTDDMIANLKAQREQLVKDGALPPDFPDIDEALAEAQRPAELAQLVAACKAV